MRVLSHLASKTYNNLTKTIAAAMLAGMVLLFAVPSAWAEDEDNDRHKATAITACGTVISQPGRYFLANDLKACPAAGIAITVSNVKVELRGHTIARDPSILFFGGLIDANGGTTGLSHLDIEGPGTVSGGNGIFFRNVHFSRVHGLVMEGNGFGLVVQAGDLTSQATIEATASTENVFSDNVVTNIRAIGILVNGGNENLFVHNNVSGSLFSFSFGFGIALGFARNGIANGIAKNNVVRHNTVDVNQTFGIVIGRRGSGNVIEDNTALGNGELQSFGPGFDLFDQNGDCTHNTWIVNSFSSQSPACSQQSAGAQTTDDDDDSIPITACGTVISRPGRYFLANDLKQCPGSGVSIAFSHVELELRGHTIAGDLNFNGNAIDADGGTTGLSYLDIKGPGTLAGADNGINFKNVHFSRVHNLVAVGNGENGIAVIGSTHNVFSDNVTSENNVGGIDGNGIFLNGSDSNLLINNNSSNGFFSFGLGFGGIFLNNAKNNVVLHNTLTVNAFGIEVFGSGNLFQGNTALGNASEDLLDPSFSCTLNTWTHNSFNTSFPACLQ